MNLKIHEFNFDTSNPDKPVGKVKTDNPLPPIPGFKYHKIKNKLPHYDIIIRHLGLIICLTP